MNSKRLLSALAVAAAALVLPAAASAQPLSHVGIGTGSSYSELRLDVEHGSTALGAKVIQWMPNVQPNQMWKIQRRADGQQQIVNENSGMCLTTSGVAGAQLYMWTCNGGPRQVWSGDLAEMRPSSTSQLQNPYTGLVMDIDGKSFFPGAHVIAWYANGAVNQTFCFVQF